MKNVIVLLGLMILSYSSVSCAPNNNEKKESSTAVGRENVSEVIHLTNDSFKKNIFDYTSHKEWAYSGNQPAIIDFYADWCGPCRMLSPLLEDVQKQYGGKLQVYKINTDKERELAATFGIQSLPTIVFIPLNGKPQAVMGYQSKEQLNEIIKEVLKVE